MISQSSNGFDNSINISSASMDHDTTNSNVIDISKNLSTTSFNNNYQQNISNNGFNQSNANSANNAFSSANQGTQPKKEGFFSSIFSYMKENWNPWKIEEVEFIDAHGFKCKRPKNKLPLRNKKNSYENEVQKAGTESVTYATQHSGFGNIFL